MTDNRNPVRSALTSLAMDLLADDLTDEASEVARVLKLYEEGRKPAPPRKRREKLPSAEDVRGILAEPAE